MADHEMKDEDWASILDNWSNDGLEDRISGGEDKKATIKNENLIPPTSITYPGLPQSLKKIPKDLQKALQDIWNRENAATSIVKIEDKKNIVTVDKISDVDVVLQTTDDEATNGEASVLANTHIVGAAHRNRWSATIAALEAAKRQKKHVSFEPKAGDGGAQANCGWEITDGLLRAGWVENLEEAEPLCYSDGEFYDEDGEVSAPMDGMEETVWYGVEVKRLEVKA